MKSLHRYLNSNPDLLFRVIELAPSGFYLRSLNKRDAIDPASADSADILLSKRLLDSLGQAVRDEEISLDYWFGLFHPDDLAVVEAKIASMPGRPTETLELEYRLRRADGSYCWIHETGCGVETDGQFIWMGALVDIDAQRAAAQAQTQQRYEVERILDTIPTYVWVKDAATRILQVNRAAAEVTGLPKSEIEGQLTADIYPIDAKRYAESDQKTLADSAIKRRPELLHGQTGQKRRMLIDKYKLKYAGGPDRILVVGTDVTDIEEARQKLQKSEEQFRLLFDSAPVGMLLIDSARNILLSNDYANNMFGYETGVAGIPADKLIPQLQSTEYLVADESRQDESPPQVGERKRLSGLRRDGAALTVEVKVTQVVIDDEDVTLVSVTDVTQRAANENRLSLAIEAGNVGFWEYIIETEAVVMSDQALRQLGQTKQWTGVEDLTTILHPEDVEGTLLRFQQYLSGEVPEYDMKFRLMHADGNYRAFLSRGRLVRDEAGQPRSVVGFHIDITEQQALQADLARSNYDLDRFAYVASHDLKAPLRRIAHLAEWVDEDSAGKLPEDSSLHLENLRSQVVQMNRLLDDLLAYSRVGRIGEDTETINLNELVPDLFAFLAPPDQVELRVEGTLPTLNTLRTALEQVFRNLIANAIQHAGSKNPTVVVSHQILAGTPCFCVRDFGKGIDPKYHERIFELFQSLQTDSGSPNTGLGLAMVRRLCERVGGKVWVESSVNEGACFFFTWPTEDEL